MPITADDITLVAKSTIWLVNLIYFIALIPQIWLNYKLKSTKGLSDFMLLGYMLGYITQVFYSYCLHLPSGYKVMIPLALAGVMVMIFQRIHYQKNDHDYLFMSLCMTLWSCTILAIPFSFIYPETTGYVAGWVAAVIWSVYQLPQAFKIYQSKSVKGLSLTFILILGLGICIETIAGFILDLPLPTIFHNVRSIVTYLIFLGIFFYYKYQDNHKRHSSKS